MSLTSGKGWTTYRCERCSTRCVQPLHKVRSPTDFGFQFGTILDVRWPSKRIKSARRFCYIQYTSPVGFLVNIYPETN